MSDHERAKLRAAVHDAMFPGACREDPMCWPRVVFKIADSLFAAGYRKNAEENK